jgi:organic radical activating enzyme
MKAKISEIFESIQGEGPYQGTKQIFIRFFGCNLNCRFCDTRLDSFQEMNLSDVLEKISLYRGYHSVSLTGGEPLLQVDFLKVLAQKLKQDGQTTYLETNGILHRNLSEVLDYIDIIAMDFKLSSSTGLKDFWLEHREFLKLARDKKIFIKSVIGKTSRVGDLRIGLGMLKELKQDILFILQPENPFEDTLKDKLKYFEKVCQNSNIDVKITPQLHKRMGVK